MLIWVSNFFQFEQKIGSENQIVWRSLKRVVENYQVCMVLISLFWINKRNITVLLVLSLKGHHVYHRWIISLPGIESKLTIFARVLLSFSYIGWQLWSKSFCVSLAFVNKTCWNLRRLCGFIWLFWSILTITSFIVLSFINFVTSSPGRLKVYLG